MFIKKDISINPNAVNCTIVAIATKPSCRSPHHFSSVSYQCCVSSGVASAGLNTISNCFAKFGVYDFFLLLGLFQLSVFIIKIKLLMLLKPQIQILPRMRNYSRNNCLLNIAIHLNFYYFYFVFSPLGIVSVFI